MLEAVMYVQFHILGTASARPASRRQVSGSLFACEDGIAVVDAGEGFQTRYAEHRKLLKNLNPPSSLRAARIDAVCLTHGHLDHTWGLLPWLQTMALDRRTRPLLVVGPTSSEVLSALIEGQPVPESAPPAELARQIRSWQTLGATKEGLGFEIRWVLGDVNANTWVELEATSVKAKPLPSLPQPGAWKDVRIVPLATRHTVPSCAWMFESKEKKGAFNRLKAAELRLTREQQTELGQGRDVVADDGEVLTAASFRGPSTRPHRFVISGDTAEQAPGLLDLDGVDVLVHEATFMEDTADHAQEHLHSTAQGATRTALACGANHLVLTHFSARIKDANLSLLEAEAAAEGSGLNISFASDGDRIQLHPNGKMVHWSKSENGWTA
jgi:ribonuclease Z